VNRFEIVSAVMHPHDGVPYRFTFPGGRSTVVPQSHKNFQTI
jgi:hypothetical protein